jgi:hypothetical protein
VFSGLKNIYKILQAVSFRRTAHPPAAHYGYGLMAQKKVKKSFFDLFT